MIIVCEAIKNVFGMEIKQIMSILQCDISKYILESKERCKKRGLDPDVIPNLESVSLLELGQKMYEFKYMLKVTDSIIEKFFQMIGDMPLQLAITDDEGVIVDVKGDPGIKNKMKSMGFYAGIKFIEETAGTNSVSLALQTNQPVQLIGTQHYHSFLKNTACYSVPFEFENLHIKGTFSIVTLAEYQSPLLLTLLANIIDLLKRELIVREQNKQLHVFNQIVTESTSNGIIKVDRNGVITEFNHTSEIITGWKQENLIGKNILQEHPLKKYIDQILKEGKDIIDIEISIKNELYNNQIICLLNGIPIYEKVGEISGAFLQLKDITERYQAMASINYLAYHDDLTTLPNRRSFLDLLKGQLIEAEKSKKMFAVFLIDLDNFKTINDTLGHKKGDILLLNVGKRLTESLPQQAKIFRIGGDEFTILLTDIHEESEAVAVAEEIVHLLRQPFILDHKELKISASVGISFYPQDGQEIDWLYSKADTAMYKAKQKGGASYTIYHA